MNPPRRTQADRRAASMEALEEAAIRALVERGAAGASTTEICKRAGLSQGALFQHYESKQDLLVAALARLYDRLRREFFSDLAGIPDDDRVRGALGALWRAYANPEAVASLELYHSSRTDPALRALLSPMLEAHWARMLEEAALVYPDRIRSRPDFLFRVSLCIAAIQGAAPGAVIEGAAPQGLGHFFSLLADILDPPEIS